MLMRFAGLLCCGVCAVQAQEPGAPAVPDALPVVEGAPADARPVAAEGVRRSRRRPALFRVRASLW